ncbi:XRCC4-like factor-domain-containing protein [Echria macrotheca]|uniref:Non-homologous end-joining factor 1 n=1 Tax=Echria macrotheca TaxID=438768 RepID=A0AAJ0B8F9_9PEZI|nr:XRCC4-like factor-domain-containing protein [Echria macrotheca]
MVGHAAWRLLPVDVSGIPNLLVSADFSDEAYTLRLTDLANVWSESMERRPIIKRGVVEDTSIDPSDGPDQIKRMLELLRAAFDPSDPEHSNTSLSIATDQKDSLLIHVTCVLPEPLKPFRWPMHLAKNPQTSLTTELVLPLILAQEAQASQVEQLVACIRDKDAVIARLVDKLEATGIGLEHVFNALSGKRRVTRKVADEKVKGLAPFREDEFRREMLERQPTSTQPDVTSILEGVFGGAGLTYESGLSLEASRLLDDWWIKLGKGRALTLADRPKQTTPGTSTPARAIAAGPSVNDEDDDFQVQATPPGLSTRKRDATARQELADDDETTDGDDDAEAPKSASLPSSGAPRQAGPRIGALGAGKRPSPPLTRSAPAPRETVTRGKDEDSSTASDTASDNEETKDSPPRRSGTRKGKLGRIGGKVEEAPVKAEDVRPSSPEAPPAASSSFRGHKLGAIGKRAPTEALPRAEQSSERGRGRSTIQPSAPVRETPRETSQERADRIRAELKRDLDRKAAAAPAKKKRKF